MIKRLFVNNYRTFQNFEISFDPLTLLLGPNGAGKTAVLDVLRLLKSFVTDQATTNELFPNPTLTRWQSTNVQTFELSLEGQGRQYAYSLQIEHNRAEQKCRVKSEELRCGQEPLYHAHLNGKELRAQLYRDNSLQGPEVLVDWHRSGIGFIQPRNDNTLLTWFRERLTRVIVLRPIPPLMEARSFKESGSLSWDSTNFVDWFRYVRDLDLGVTARLQASLEKTLPGFEGLKLTPNGGDAKILEVSFKPEASVDFQAKPYSCRFDELSEGQRLLFVLYTLLATDMEDYTLCLDEPENFLALPEIQPWLNALIDKTQSQQYQALLVSHHPLLINALAVGAGRWLDRIAGVSTRTRPITEDGGGLSIAELVERGWLHA